MQKLRHPLSTVPRPDEGTPIEGQRFPLQHANTWRGQPDIRQLERIGGGRIVPNADEPERYRHITRPGGVHKVDWSVQIATSLVGGGGLITYLLIPQNDRRKGFSIENSPSNADVIYYSYGPSPLGRHSLIPSEKRFEEGSEVSVDNIFVYAPSGYIVVAYECIPLDFRRDELWNPRR
jgi:hypothetical protein